MKKALAAVLVLVTASVLHPTTASAGQVNYSASWTVLDNGGWGMPGNNVFAWRCGSGLGYTSSYINTTVWGTDGTYCSGDTVGADAYRYVTDLTLTVNGVLCITISDSSNQGAAGAGATTSTMCGANGTNSSEVRHFDFFMGGFCGPCTMGYQIGSAYVDTLP